MTVSEGARAEIAKVLHDHWWLASKPDYTCTCGHKAPTIGAHRAHVADRIDAALRKENAQ